MHSVSNYRPKFSCSRFLVALVLATILLPATFAQAASNPPQTQNVQPVVNPNVVPQRDLGSQIFSIDLGLNVPLFTAAPDGTIVPGMNLTLGGAGSLKWGAFLNQSYFIGVDITGSFSLDPNKDPFGLVQIGPRTGFIFRAGPFEFPVSLAPQFAIFSYKGLSSASFDIKAEAGVYFDATPSWSFGVNASYVLAPDIYLDGSANNRIGNLLHVTLCALYSF